MAKYHGVRTESGVQVVKEDRFGVRHLTPEKSFQHRRHSPDGFNWGYAGSGPAQLALALLLEETGSGDAQVWYQFFKREVVARWEDEWTITSEEIHAWLAKKRPVEQPQWEPEPAA